MSARYQVVFGRVNIDDPSIIDVAQYLGIYGQAEEAKAVAGHLSEKLRAPWNEYAHKEYLRGNNAHLSQDRQDYYAVYAEDDEENSL